MIFRVNKTRIRYFCVLTQDNAWRLRRELITLVAIATLC